MGKMKDLLLEMCETPMRDVCPECDGKGEVEVEIARPQGFNRDIGYLDTAWETCEDCHGDGVVDRTCVECGYVIYKAHHDHNNVLVVAAHDATLCEECLS